MGKVGFCTIISRNYYAQACNLANSIKNNCNRAEVYVLIADGGGEIGDAVFSEQNRDFITLGVRELGINSIHEYINKYDLVEFNTFLKPFFIKYLFDVSGLKKVIYLDPDIMAFHDFDDVFKMLDQHSIVLTPHLLSEKENVEERNTLEELKFGIYNLGFIGLNCSETAKDFLKWWGQKLKSFCRLDLEHGLAWDQKWCDLVPAFFDEVYILRQPNYNVAFWNLYERKIAVKNGIYYVNDDYPLAFFHFSHYKVEHPSYLAYFDDKNYISFPDADNHVKTICDKYRAELMKYDYMRYANLCYGNRLQL